MITRYSASFLVLCLAGVSVAVAPLSAAAAELTPDQQQWVMPRTPDGHPDLQGNWSNATLTPIQRPEGSEAVLTWDEVATREGRRQGLIETTSAASDPDREAPEAGGGVGGYNYVYIDGGDHIAIYNGEPRSSLISNPADGRIPSLTPEAEERVAERREFNSQFGEFDNPENRGLAERCIMSYGSNAGPPMLPNYFYNNNYTIVQTPDHVLIMTEMVHDARIIRIGDGPRLPPHVRPWFGDSWGRW